MIIDQLFETKLIQAGEVYAMAVAEAHNAYDNDSDQQQLDELSFKDIQNKLKSVGKGATKFGQDVKNTGDAAAGALNAIGGAGKELGKQLIARPTAAAYNAVKGGIGNAADVAKGLYGDAKQATQAVGQAADTVGTDAGQVINKIGRGLANVTGGTARAVGAVAGGATTGLGRAAVKGFNTGVQNVGGAAVGRAQTNVFRPKSDTAKIQQQIALKKQEISGLETQLKNAQGGAERQAYAGNNPDTGRPYTGDELRALVPASTDTAAPLPSSTTTAASNPAAFNADNVRRLPVAPAYNKVTTKFNKPAATYNFQQQQDDIDAINRQPAESVAEATQATRIVDALTRPVAELLQMVETKEHVAQIKQFVDQTFLRYGAVNESAFVIRNQILEHVTQVGAQRRRAHACMS